MNAHRSGVAVLRQQAEEQGWETKIAKNGHIEFVAPSGRRVQLAATPSDWRAFQNNVHKLRALGLEDRSSDEARETRMARIQIRGGTHAEKVLSALQAYKGETVSTFDVSGLTGLSQQQTANALNWLLTNHPEVERPERGKYRFVPKPKRARSGAESSVDTRTAPRPYQERVVEREVFERTPDPITVEERPLAPATNGNGHTNGNGNGNGNGHDEPPPVEPPPVELRTVPGRPINVVASNLSDAVPGMFEAVTTDRHNNVILRDENGDLWVARPIWSPEQ